MNDAPRRSYRWMRELLDLLFEHVDPPAVARLLRDRDEREQISTFIPPIEALRLAHREVGDDEFDNLLVALLSLRGRFDRADAANKVELNIAMREGRR